MFEVARGLTGLAVAAFFFVWAGVDWAAFLFGVPALITAARPFLRNEDAAATDASLARQVRAVLGPPASGWRLAALYVVLGVLVVLCAVRIAGLRSGTMDSAASSDAERWLPLLLTAVVSSWFVISAALNRLPRHLLAGAVGLGGAIAGPLLGFAWRDSLALAAAVMGLVLIVDGAIARRQSCLPS